MGLLTPHYIFTILAVHLLVSSCQTPIPKQLNYTLYYDKEQKYVCLALQFAASLEVTYTQQNEKLSKNTVTINLPPDCSYVGECLFGEAVLNVTSKWIGLNLTFHKHSASEPAYLTSTELSLLMNEFNFPNLPMEITGLQKFISHQVIYEIPQNYSLFCYSATKQPFQRSFKDMREGVNIVYLLQVTLSISNVWMEPFYGNTTFEGFSEVSLCPADNKNVVAVPLIVGFILLGLMAAVLTSYFVVRHQTRLGYESVS